MSCLTPDLIAQAATTGALPDHVADCLACRRALDRDRSLRAALQALPVPRLDAERRRTLAAETLTRATHRARPSRRRWLIAPVLAAAAASLLLLRSPPTTPPSTVEATEPLTIGDRATAREDVPPPLPAPHVEASGGAHVAGIDTDTIVLTDGELDIDTRASRDLDVRVGVTTVHVLDGRVRVRAHDHALTSVQVVVGAAQIVGPDQHVTLERDAMWVAAAPAIDRSLAAFRDGWKALRAGRDTEAITLFDRASQGAVAEEATYWAAIAAQRAGDPSAQQRLSDFVARFPQSPFAPHVDLLQKR
jgi:hypothetical protein